MKFKWVKDINDRHGISEMKTSMQMKNGAADLLPRERLLRLLFLQTTNRHTNTGS